MSICCLHSFLTESTNITIAVNDVENGNLLLLFIDLIRTLTDGNIVFEFWIVWISNIKCCNTISVNLDFLSVIAMQIGIEMCICYAFYFTTLMQIFSVEFQLGCVSIVGLRVHEFTSDAKWNEDKSNEIAKYAMLMSCFKLHSIRCSMHRCTHLICKLEKYIYRLNIFRCVTQDLAYIPHLIHLVTTKPNTRSIEMQ